MIIHAVKALRYVEAALGSRKSHIELAGVLCQLAGIATAVEVGDASVNGVKYYYIVKLQAFRLMYGRDEDGFAKAAASA